MLPGERSVLGIYRYPWQYLFEKLVVQYRLALRCKTASNATLSYRFEESRTIGVKSLCGMVLKNVREPGLRASVAEVCSFSVACVKQTGISTNEPVQLIRVMSRIQLIIIRIPNAR